MALFLDLKPLLTKSILKKKKENIARAIRQGVLFATEWLIGKVVEDQMSGRVRYDYGLNRKSGNLARNWKKEITNDGLWITAKAWPTMFYAKFHQKPGPNAKYPKRLYIVEYFKANAKKVYFSEVSDAIKRSK